MQYEERYAVHPDDAKGYDTERLRKEFLIEKLFEPDDIRLVYSSYDRLIVGGVMPVKQVLELTPIDPLKAPYFLHRRELGIINVGGKGVVCAGDIEFKLDYKEALYLGSGDRTITFRSEDASAPALFYINSAPAHRNYSDRKVTKADAVVAHMGSLEDSNERTINKLIVTQVLPTCQLQMGMTELKTGSVWNTMPAHTHNRRMEAYCRRRLPYVILWGNPSRPATSGCTTIRPCCPRRGRSIRPARRTIIRLSGEWPVKTSTTGIWIPVQ